MRAPGGTAAVGDGAIVWLRAIAKPPLFKPAEMIARAVAQFRSIDSDPMQMGRSAGAYDALRIYPATLVEVMRDVKEASNRAGWLAEDAPIRVHAAGGRFSFLSRETAV